MASCFVCEGSGLEELFGESPAPQFGTCTNCGGSGVTPDPAPALVIRNARLYFGDQLVSENIGDVTVNPKPSMEEREQAIRDAKRPPCTNCGKVGSHFAPPSLGEPGFYTCKQPIVCLGCGAEVEALIGLCDHCGHDHEFDPDPRLPNPARDEFMVRVYAGEERDPVDLAMRRASPFPDKQYPSGTMVRFAWPSFELASKAINKPWAQDYDRLPDVPADFVYPGPIPPSFTGRWAKCLPEMQDLNWMRRLITKRAIDLDYAVTEARIVGHLLGTGYWPTEEDRVRYSIVASARRRTDTALATLAEAKVIDLPMERHYYSVDLGGDPFSYTTYYGGQSGGKTYWDIESWGLGGDPWDIVRRSPSGVISGNPQMEAYLRGAMAANIEANRTLGLLYGQSKADYQKFNKRKR